jgi:dihydrofolate reductase
MGRIVVNANVTVDGVVQDPTGDEGFTYGGWFERMSDADRAEWAKVEFQEALDGVALLVGRLSYGWFAERWADRPGDWADQLRKLPKYIVSSTLEDPTGWGEATVLRGDVVEEVTKLKQSVDGDIIVYASGSLVQTLLEQDLVDEWRLMTHPIVLGAGARLFRATGDQKPLRLVAVHPVGESLVLLTYQPARQA